MAIYYVSSVDGTDAEDGSTWALAKSTVAGALAVAVTNNDIIYVDSAHSENSGSAVITWDVATAGNHVSIISVNRNGSTTTGHSGWLAGAKATVGANAFAFNALIANRSQSMFIFGVTIETNNGASNSNSINLALSGGSSLVLDLWMKNCTLSTLGSGASADVLIGAVNATRTNTKVRLSGCTINGHNTSTASTAFVSIQMTDLFIDHLTVAYSGANKPPLLFRGTTSSGTGNVEIVDSDLSGFNSGAYIGSNMLSGHFYLINCKLHATPSIASGTWITNQADITVINCDSGDTAVVFEYRNRLGTITENTSVYLNNGAQFNSTPVSWEINTTAFCEEGQPFTSPWLHRWNSSTSVIRPSLYLVHDHISGLHDRNLWSEFEFVSSSSFPIGTLTGTRNLQPFDGTPAFWPVGSYTWNGTGSFATGLSHLISGDFTPAEKSLLRARLFVGISGKTSLYLNPEIIV